MRRDSRADSTQLKNRGPQARSNGRVLWERRSAARFSRGLYVIKASRSTGPLLRKSVVGASLRGAILARTLRN